MDPKLDLAKVVGAASAPVALIIASCIYLGNMTQKYNTLFQKIRDLSEELRKKPDDEERVKSIHEQLHLYERRIDGTMSCTFWLNMAIICFVLTVLFTGLAALLPGNGVVMVTTMLVMVAGILIFTSAVVVEVWSNRLAKPTLKTELTSGTPEYEPVMAEHR